MSTTAHRTAISPLVRSFELENGLRVYVLPRDFAPTFTGYYHFAVGSAHDPKGRSGIAHLLEHMMFKGTRHIGVTDAHREVPIMSRLSELWHELQRELDNRDDPFHQPNDARVAELQDEIQQLNARHKQLVVPNEYSELITRAGGTGMNATTSTDVTRYFVQLPSNQLELWFQLESQRLLEPVFREFYTERDVVLEERRLRTDNQPEGKAFEAQRRMLYAAHPYGTPVIGWPRDIERLTREDALAYFRTWYSPSNCIMVLVGDVHPDEVERLAKKYLGGWQRQDLPHLHMTAEPEHDGERRQIVEFDAEPHLRLGWVTVPEGHPDHYPLQILSSILGELSSSRLNQSLVVDRRIASGVGSFHWAQKYSGSFYVVARPNNGHELQEIEAAIFEVLGKIQRDGADQNELERAKIYIEASHVRRQVSNINLAMDLGAGVLVAGSPSYLEEYEQRINAVEATQVVEVARRYLDPSRMSAIELRRPPDAGLSPVATLGGAASLESDAHVRTAPPADRGAIHSSGFKQSLEMIESAPPVNIHIPEVGSDVDRRVLECGITAYLKPDHSLPALTMDMVFTGGSNTAPVDELSQWVLASQLLLEGGTAELDPAAVERRKEDLGLKLSLSVGATRGAGRLWSLERNFTESLALLSDVLMRPRLDGERLEVLKGKHNELMRRRYDYPSWGIGFIGQKVLHDDIPHLGYQPTKAQIDAITPADILGVISRSFGPQNMFITVTGDFDRNDVITQIEERLGPWPAATHPEREWIVRPPAERPGVHLVEKEIPQPAVRIVQELAVDREAPVSEHAALEILNRILGGSGFRSRLMERIRSAEGLTYGISSTLRHQGRPGVPGGFAVSYQTRSDAVTRSMDIVREECEHMRQRAVSQHEVIEQIQAWRNQFIFRFENEAYAVSRLMHHELDDRPYDFDQLQLEQVEKVTPDDVLEVAKRYLDPTRFTTLVFGSIPASDLQHLESEVGVTIWDKDVVFAGGY